MPLLNLLLLLVSSDRVKHLPPAPPAGIGATRQPGVSWQLSGGGRNASQLGYEQLSIHGSSPAVCALGAVASSATSNLVASCTPATTTIGVATVTVTTPEPGRMYRCWRVPAKLSGGSSLGLLAASKLKGCAQIASFMVDGVILDGADELGTGFVELAGLRSSTNNTSRERGTPIDCSVGADVLSLRVYGSKRGSGRRGYLRTSEVVASYRAGHNWQKQSSLEVSAAKTDDNTATELAQCFIPAVQHWEVDNRLAAINSLGPV
eukprot:COSAG05_NODE_4185_length_1633_cov_1.773142_1_plen_262_part_10